MLDIIFGTIVKIKNHCNPGTENFILQQKAKKNKNKNRIEVESLHMGVLWSVIISDCLYDKPTSLPGELHACKLFK